MSSDDRNYANMLNDADSADEVSDHEESDELPRATGNNHHGAAADTENETSAALWREETSASGGSDQGEKCSCNSSRPTRLAFEALQMRCMLCGGLINGSGTNRGKVNRLVSSPTRMEGPGPLIGVVPPLFAESLPALPSTSLEDNTSEQDGGSPSSQQRAASLVTGRSWQKTPVHHASVRSVQWPLPGMRVRMFLFERTHQETNGKWYILYFIPENEFQVYQTIQKSYKDTDSQEGYSTRQIPFSVDNGRSEEFHTVYVQEQITVSFKLQSQLQDNFVALDAGRKYDFRVPFILCECKNRVTPGAKSQFRVEYVGGPGKLVQEQGKITLVIDSVQCILLFSISIWVPDG